MSYPDAGHLAQSYSLTTRLINNFITGITDAAACATPLSSVNSLNWVLGHILTSRQQVARALGGEDFMPEAASVRYMTGSDPVTPESSTMIPLSTLQEFLQASQESLADALATAAPEDLAQVIETRFGPRPVGQHVAGLHWHETFHVGQLEILREFALAAEE